MESPQSSPRSPLLKKSKNSSKKKKQSLTSPSSSSPSHSHSPSASASPPPSQPSTSSSTQKRKKQHESTYELEEDPNLGMGFSGSILEVERYKEDESKKATSSSSSSSSSQSLTSALSTLPVPIRTFTSSEKYKLCNNNEFFVLFNNSTYFKTLIELIHQILDNIHIRVVNTVNSKGKHFQGIKINSVDKNKTSMIVAQLEGNVIFPETLKQYDFCVPSKLLSSLVKIIIPGCCLELQQRKGDNTLMLKTYTADRKSYEYSSSLPTITFENEWPQIQIMNYKFVVDMDLQILKGIVKVAQNIDINAENVSFKIYQNFNEKNNTKTTKFCVSLDSDANHPSLSQTFRSVTKWERDDKSKITEIKTSKFNMDEDCLVDDDELKLVFDEKYSAGFLNKFLKSIESPFVIIKLNPKKPLVFIYPLSPDDNVGYCTFIVAPSRKESDAEAGDQDDDGDGPEEQQQQ